MPRDAQFATEFEKIVLHVGQAFLNFLWHGFRRENDADRLISLIHGSVRLDPHRILGYTAAVAKPGRTVIAGPGVNFAKSVSHVETIGRLPMTVKIRRLFLAAAAAIVAPSLTILE